MLDWLPSRIFSFGYVLCGEFKSSMDVWRHLVFQPAIPARDIVVQTAMAAEPLACPLSEEISLEPTIAMLALSKRNFILILVSTLGKSKKVTEATFGCFCNIRFSRAQSSQAAEV